MRSIADGVLGSLLGFRGELGAARRCSSARAATARRLDIFSMQVDCAASLALVAAHDSDLDAALERCRFVLSRWERSEDHHYAVWGLRRAAWLFARSGDRAGARRAEALRDRGNAGHSDALAALAHALGRSRCARASRAPPSSSRARSSCTATGIPVERVQIALRAGVALARPASASRRSSARPRPTASRAACGARPLAGAAAAMRRSASRRSGGSGAAAAAHEAGLSRRELEVMHLVAAGRTNREIAARVLPQPAHGRHARAQHPLKLSCRTRTEAATRAAELGLLV